MGDKIKLILTIKEANLLYLVIRAFYDLFVAILSRLITLELKTFFYLYKIAIMGLIKG